MAESDIRKTLATTVLGESVLRLSSFKGHEALSEPFRFRWLVLPRTAYS